MSLTSIRWGGLAAIVGGVGFAALLVFGGLWYSRPDFPPILTTILAYWWIVGSFGIVALGSFATIGFRMLPWWCWALIILGSPPAIFLYIFPFLLGGLPVQLLGLLGIGIRPSAPINVSLMGIAWALVGYVLFRRAGDRLSTPRRVR